MRIGKLHTLWIIIASLWYTLVTTTLSIVGHFFGISTRPWVDKRMHIWERHLLRLAGITCKVHNPHQTKPQPGQPTIVMCNHTSIYDIPISMHAFPHHSLRMLAKKELSRIPFLGKGMAAAEFLFIDRKNKRQAIKDLEAVKKLLESGIVMWIAPEGTRSTDGKLARFKKGPFITAISTKATIIPFGIRGAFNILPSGSLQLNYNQTAEVYFGQPIDASQYTLENKDALIERTYQSIKALAEGPEM